MDIKKEASVITKITILTFTFNAILLITKLVLGILGNSMAVINGAIDSGLDIIVTAVVLIVGRYSRRKADKNHPYGHEKFESVVAILLGIMMIITAVSLVGASINILIDYFGESGEAVIKTPNILAVIASFLTIIIKLGLFIVTVRASIKAKSPSLKALAIDHISDVIVSIFLVISVIFAMVGYLYFEPVAAIIIALVIGYNGIVIIKESISQVVDEAADNETVRAIKTASASINGVLAIDMIKTRKFGLKLYVDIEIAVDGNVTVNESHEIAETVHELIIDTFEDVKHCMVHVNPAT